MKIPAWAEQTLQAHKPLPSQWSSDGKPDPVSLALWTSYSERFRRRWSELDADHWTVPKGDQQHHTGHNILTAALDGAKRLGKGAHPSKMVEARKHLLQLDRKISDLAEQLASTFRDRDQLQKDYGVASWREDQFSSDPMDLWDALEMTFNPHPGSGREHPQADVWPDLKRSIDIARTTSLSVPEWPDLLEQLGERFEFGTASGEFPDIATQGSNTNKSEYSPWCNSLIQLLQDWQLLDCLSLPQLAGLASVAFAASNDAINPKQIGDLKRNQLKRG